MLATAISFSVSFGLLGGGVSSLAAPVSFIRVSSLLNSPGVLVSGFPSSSSFSSSVSGVADLASLDVSVAGLPSDEVTVTTGLASAVVAVAAGLASDMVAVATGLASDMVAVAAGLASDMVAVAADLASDMVAVAADLASEVVAVAVRAFFWTSLGFFVGSSLLPFFVLFSLGTALISPGLLCTSATFSGW